MNISNKKQNKYSDFGEDPLIDLKIWLACWIGNLVHFELIDLMSKDRKIIQTENKMHVRRREG